MYMVCHEVDHIVLNHPTEMVKSNPNKDEDLFRKFNLAADASVNDRIDYEIATQRHKFLSHPEDIITSSVLAEMFHLGSIRKMENYIYYLNLIKNRKSNGQASMLKLQIEEKKDPEESGGRGKNKGGGDGEGSDSGSESGEKKGSDTSGEGTDEGGSETVMAKASKEGGDLGKSIGDGDSEESDSGSESGEEQGSDTDGEGTDADSEIVTAKTCTGSISDHDWRVEDVEVAAATVKEFVNGTVGMMSTETRGLMPTDFMSQVEEINKPPVLSWQAILKKYVGTISANKKKTRTRLNRRQPERFDLSGTMEDKVLKIVVAIDTSGSVSDFMIGQILNEIFAILAKRKHEITVIECDAQVQRVYKAKEPTDIQKKVSGRGGTAFSPVITYVNNDKYFRDALLIYFTDGYGELSIPKPRTYRNIWVILDGKKNLSLEEPYGIVLAL